MKQIRFWIISLVATAVIATPGCRHTDSKRARFSEYYAGANVSPESRIELRSFWEEIHASTSAAEVQTWAVNLLSKVRHGDGESFLPSAEWPEWLWKAIRSASLGKLHPNVTSDSPFSFLNMTGGTNAVVFLERSADNVEDYVTIVIGGSMGLKGLLIGSDEFRPKLEKDENHILLEWIPGVYFVYVEFQ